MKVHGFSAIFFIFLKGNSFCDFLFVSPGDETLPTSGLLLGEGDSFQNGPLLSRSGDNENGFP